MLPSICLENLTGVQFFRIAPLTWKFYSISFKGLSWTPSIWQKNILIWPKLCLPPKCVMVWVTVCRMWANHNFQGCNSQSVQPTGILDTGKRQRPWVRLCVCTVDDIIYKSTKSWAGSYISSQNGGLCSGEQWLVTVMAGGDSRWKDKLSLIYLCRQWSRSACRDVNSCQFRLFGLFADKHSLFFSQENTGSMEWNWKVWKREQKRERKMHKQIR